MKILIALNALLISTVVTIAQSAPLIAWQNSIGGSGSDYLNCADNTTDGGCILGGSSSSVAAFDKTENSFGQTDYWVVKLNSAGAIEWENTIGGSSYDNLFAIEQTTDGGYILGGHSASGISGDKTGASQGNYDYWIIKLDTAGVIEWQKTIGGSNIDFLSSIQQTSDEGYIIGGQSLSGISGDKTEASAGFYDYWIVKISATGDIEWQNTIGGNADDDLVSVRQTSDNGYILGGWSASGISGEKTEDNFGSSADYWILKLNASGNIEWQNTIGGNKDDKLYTVRQTAEGGYILGGYSYSGISGDKTEENISVVTNSKADYWVVKTDMSGNIEWQNTIGGDLNDYLYSMEQTIDGGYILGGSSSSGITGDKTELNYGNIHSTDYWVVKIDVSGSVLWDKAIGSVGSDDCKAILQTADNGYIIAGGSSSSASGNKTETSNGSEDYWIVKLVPDGAVLCASSPTDLYADHITATKAKLHWTPDAGAIKYKLQYRTSVSAVWTTVNATMNAKTINGLTANTAYDFRVRTQCSGGLSSPWSSIETFTTLPLKGGAGYEFAEMSIYPNPNNGNFVIRIPQFIDTDHAVITIQNAEGQICFSTTSNTLQTTIDAALLAGGMYVITVQSGTKIFHTKLLKTE